MSKLYMFDNVDISLLGHREFVLYALINDSKKTCSLHVTGSFMESITGILREIKLDHTKYRDTNIRILELGPESVPLKLAQDYYQKLFQEQDYLVMNKRGSTSFDIRVIMKDRCLQVIAKFDNGDDLVLGVFDSNTLCEQFINQYYVDNGQEKFYNLVYSRNKLTKKYYQKFNKS